MRKTLGKQKSEILAKKATEEVGFVDDVMEQYDNLLSERLGVVFKEGDVAEAPGRASIVNSQADKSLLKNIRSQLISLGKEPTVQRVDDTVDAIQALVVDARSLKDVVTLNSRVESVTNSVQQSLNKQLKQFVGGDYARVNQQYGTTIGLIEEMNRKLGKKGERAGALMKRIFSPSDNRTKEMFREIEAITGDNLIEEATLAKFAMQVAGDSRQLSLLEEVGVINGSVKQRLIESTFSAIQEGVISPERRARKAAQQAVR